MTDAHGHETHHEWFEKYMAKLDREYPRGTGGDEHRELGLCPTSRIRQWSPADALVSDGPERAGPVGAALQCLDDAGDVGFAATSGEAKQDHAAACRQARAERKLAEILVKGEQDALLGHRPRQHRRIAAASH